MFLALGIKYIEQDDYKWLYRIEMTSQRLLKKVVFFLLKIIYQGSNRKLLSNRDGTIQLHKMYWPKDENYYINYIF